MFNYKFQNKCNDGLDGYDDDEDDYPPHANIPTSLPTDVETSTTVILSTTASTTEEPETTPAIDVIEIIEDSRFSAVEAVGH